jgi:argininosuccinate lyase
LCFIEFFVGKAVKFAENKGIAFNELSLEELKSLSDAFEEDVSALWSYEHR